MKKDDFNDIELLDDDNAYEINIPKFDKIEYPNDSLDDKSEEKSTEVVDKNILQKKKLGSRFIFRNSILIVRL